MTVTAGRSSSIAPKDAPTPLGRVRPTTGRQPRKLTDRSMTPYARAGRPTATGEVKSSSFGHRPLSHFSKEEKHSTSKPRRNTIPAAPAQSDGSRPDRAPLGWRMQSAPAHGASRGRKRRTGPRGALQAASRARTRRDPRPRQERDRRRRHVPA